LGIGVEERGGDTKLEVAGEPCIRVTKQKDLIWRQIASPVLRKRGKRASRFVPTDEDGVVPRCW